MKSSRRAVLVAATLSTALLGTGSSGVAAQDEVTTARVRVLHASPDAPAVDIYAGDEVILPNLTFGVISDYLEVPAGEYRIRVVAAAADPSEAAVIDETLTFEAGSMTTVAATNALASIEARVIVDAPEPSADSTRVRVVHLSADAPAVDIALDGGDVVVGDLAYPAATDYLTLPAAQYDLEIRPAGSTDVALDIPALTLEAGTSYSAFAIGSPADGSLRVLPVVDAVIVPEVTTARVRVLHASPDAPAVDIYAGDEVILPNLTFGVISDYLEVPAGEYRIRVVAAAADPSEAAVIDETLTFEAGSMTTVAATNALASIEARVIVDAPAPTADEAQVRIVHFSADAPAVDVAPDGKRKAIVRGLAYPAATDYLALPAGEYDLEIRRAGRDRVLLDIPAITLESGTSYTLFAIGSRSEGSFRVLPAVDAVIQTEGAAGASQ